MNNAGNYSFTIPTQGHDKVIGLTREKPGKSWYFPGLQSHGILWPVMENYTYKWQIEHGSV